MHPRSIHGTYISASEDQYTSIQHVSMLGFRHFSIPPPTPPTPSTPTQPPLPTPTLRMSPSKHANARLSSSMSRRKGSARSDMLRGRTAAAGRTVPQCTLVKSAYHIRHAAYITQHVTSRTTNAGVTDAAHSNNNIYRSSWVPRSIVACNVRWDAFLVCAPCAPPLIPFQVLLQTCT